MRRDEASENQVIAAEPGFSTWLSANAGSGKTRVLIDRVARLLLRRVPPQHILCLTYTKAAATEMQNRLFQRLGEWAMLPDECLSAALADLGEDGARDPELLAEARRLFARAIETPGGLRIQTIHSFCASLLRRFPLEAGVPPAFQEMDDRAAQLLRHEVVEEMAEWLAPAVIAATAAAFPAEDFDALTRHVATNRAAFSGPVTMASLLADLGLSEDESQESILASVFLGGEADLIAAIRAAVAQSESAQEQTLAQRLAPVNAVQPGFADLRVLEDAFLTTAAPYSVSSRKGLVKASRARLGEMADALDQLAARVESARPRRAGWQAAERSLTLHRFAAAFLPLYEARKAQRGLLDFDDLILRAVALLTDPGLAAWVLFRLDGGIDHILVDEAQDTSPTQWRVIELLAEEFSAGEGARAGDRTLFVVGDKKQSIYSFQGADVRAFDEKSRGFEARFRAAGKAFNQRELLHSFRSSPAILTLVDRTFDNRHAQAVGEGVRHVAFKSGLPGRVDLWPLRPPSASTKDENWQDPVDLISDEHHTALLAADIADAIQGMIRSGTCIPVDPREDPRGFRPMHEGDVLILVQRRSALFSEIIRACKRRGLAIAGADRLRLGAELAVKDIAALLGVLATPEDDLSLATALRSPLFGWSEDQLFRLSHGRKGFLWESLRALPEDTPALAILNDLRSQADFLRPYDLVERLLTRHDGRRRLIARLGPEAEDGIDQLLGQALAYERLEVPSLTGFLIWLQTSDLEVKRQPDSAGRRIRVMTVHGAKGLEAPVVILPDTTDRRPNDTDPFVVSPRGTALARASGMDGTPAHEVIQAERRAAERAESLRLLYVAMTRARTWLIVAGAGKVKDDREDDALGWYLQVRAGFEASGHETLPDGTLRHAVGDWPAPQALEKPPEQPEPARLPDWALTPAPDAPREVQGISPSGLGGAKVMPGDGAPPAETLAEEGDTTDASAEDRAKAAGTAIHLLLEHLPDVPRPDRAAAARSLLGAGASVALGDALRVLDDPDLAWLFGPESLAEVQITADLAGRPLMGAIDRLLVMPDRVLAVDYKTNRLIPERPEDVPEGLLRQMGAYSHALAQIWPGRRIETAILWTARPLLMPLPHAIVTAALQRAGLT